jgi:D-glycero-D-manno-heptose 1,7-bisphosphate phosphatase
MRVYAEAATSTGKALFLDRDGVINEEVGYLHAVEDVRWVSGIFELCQTATALEYKLVVVTNQSGIGRGLYTEAQFGELMVWMRAQFAQRSLVLNGVYFCPYHPEHGAGSYRREHEDRKPGPGMLLRAARELRLDLTQSIMVGDRCSDIAAANAAGLRQAFLLGERETAQCGGLYLAVQSLAEVQAWLTSSVQMPANAVDKAAL